MISITLAHSEWFEILDESTQTRYNGVDQDWYGEEWQRTAGCGPATAANIVHYAWRKKSLVCRAITKSQMTALMEEMWQYVTPTANGIPTTELFCGLFDSYLEAKGLKTSRVACCLDLRRDGGEFLPFKRILEYLETSLRNDNPVAFLNLCNGDALELESWHWVTVISLRFDLDADLLNATIEILDAGSVKRVDLALWYQTTTKGGGFVSFDLGGIKAD